MDAGPARPPSDVEHGVSAPDPVSREPSARHMGTGAATLPRKPKAKEKAKTAPPPPDDGVSDVEDFELNIYVELLLLHVTPSSLSPSHPLLCITYPLCERLQDDNFDILDTAPPQRESRMSWGTILVVVCTVLTFVSLGVFL